MLKCSGDLLRGELAVSCLTISLSLSSSGSEGGGSEEEAAALHRSLQVPAQLTQPFVCLRSLHPLCSHQPGGKRERGKTGKPRAPPHPPPLPCTDRSASICTHTAALTWLLGGRAAVTAEQQPIAQNSLLLTLVLGSTTSHGVWCTSADVAWCSWSSSCRAVSSVQGAPGRAGGL